MRPRIDGVIIKKGHAGATFLPQVWDQLPGPEQFLSHLCMKAGLPAQQMCDHLLEHLIGYHGASQQDDDITLVAIHNDEPAAQ